MAEGCAIIVVGHSATVVGRAECIGVGGDEIICDVKHRYGHRVPRLAVRCFLDCAACLCVRDSVCVIV